MMKKVQYNYQTEQGKDRGGVKEITTYFLIEKTHDLPTTLNRKGSFAPRHVNMTFQNRMS